MPTALLSLLTGFFGRHRAAGIPALFLAAWAIYAAGNGGHSLWDRDEARYAEATREMIASGDWVIPHLNGAIRYDKPILIYWLMSVPMRLGGSPEFAARLPGATAGAALVVFVWLLAGALGCSGGARAIATLAALSFSLELIVSKAATTDGVLACTVAAAAYLHWEQQRRGFAWGRHAAFWAVVGLSILDKGPIGPGILALQAITFAVGMRAMRGEKQAEGSASTGTTPASAGAGAAAPAVLWRAMAGVAVTAAVVAPWVVPVWLRTQGDFFRVAIGHHVVDRTLQPMEGHSGPIFYYLALLPGLVFPWTAAVLVALRVAWRRRREPAVWFLWSWFLPGLVMFSSVSTKLPHYLAPLLPALALMVGLWWRNAAEQQVSRWWWRAGALLMALVGLVLFAGLPATLLASRLLKPLAASRVGFLLTQLPGGLLAAIATVGLVWGAGILAGAHFWWRERPQLALAAWLSSFAVAGALLMFWFLPALEPLRPSRPIGEWIRAHAPADARLIATGYKEPSLMFYAARPMDDVNPGAWSDTLAALGEKTPTVLVITEEQWNLWCNLKKAVVPERVGVRFRGEYLVPQRGARMTLVVVCNFP